MPVLSVWLIRYRAEEPAAKKGLFERILPAFQRIVDDIIRLRWIVVPAYLAACGLLLWLVGQAGRHRIVSPGGFRPVRDSISQSSGFGI